MNCQAVFSNFISGASVPVFGLIFDDFAAYVFELINELIPAPWYTPDMSIPSAAISD
jgi:hypothetical protein